jgi:hypothetical protein
VLDGGIEGSWRLGAGCGCMIIGDSLDIFGGSLLNSNRYRGVLS